MLRIWPTRKEIITRTVPLCILLVSLSHTWFYRECCHIFEAKWDEVMDEAIFNDLDGDGLSVVTIRYKPEP
jgi:hypothetical protein